MCPLLLTVKAVCGLSLQTSKTSLLASFRNTILRTSLASSDTLSFVILILVLDFKSFFTLLLLTDGATSLTIWNAIQTSLLQRALVNNGPKLYVEANFCNLATKSDTRFLFVTHSRICLSNYYMRLAVADTAWLKLQISPKCLAKHDAVWGCDGENSLVA